MINHKKSPVHQTKFPTRRSRFFRITLLLFAFATNAAFFLYIKSNREPVVFVPSFGE